MGQKASDMGGHALAFLEGFYGMSRQAHVELFAQQSKRHAVVMFVDLDVVVDVDAGDLPLGVFVELFGQWQRVGSIEERKELMAGLLELAQRSVV